MKRIILISSAIFLANLATAADRGAELMTQLCSSCHGNGAAPPMFGVRSHVKSAYPEREAFVDYVVDWVRQPDASKSLMPGAIRHFGLMPSLGYGEAEVRQVAEYLYDGRLEATAGSNHHRRHCHGRGRGH